MFLDILRNNTGTNCDHIIITDIHSHIHICHLITITNKSIQVGAGIPLMFAPSSKYAISLMVVRRIWQTAHPFVFHFSNLNIVICTGEQIQRRRTLGHDSRCVIRICFIVHLLQSMFWTERLGCVDNWPPTLFQCCCCCTRWFILWTGTEREIHTIDRWTTNRRDEMRWRWEGRATRVLH